MIQISPRVGSIELSELFKAFDVPVDTSIDLPFSDFCFLGNGPDGLCRVGVERKQLSDLLDSIRSKRLSGHQLGGLCAEFDYVIIIIEGQWKSGEHGELLAFKHGRWQPTSDGKHSALYRSVQNYTLSLRLRAGTFAGNPIITERTLEPFETVAAVVSWWHNFNDKQWDQHKSHEAVYNKEYRGPGGGGEGHKPKNFMRRSISDFEYQLAATNGIDDYAKYIAERFGSMVDLCQASMEEIAECPVEQFMKAGGKRTVKLGAKRAEKIWKGLRGR